MVPLSRVVGELGCGAYIFASGEPGLSNLVMRLVGDAVDEVEWEVLAVNDGWCARAGDAVLAKKSVIGRVDPRVAFC